MNRSILFIAMASCALISSCGDGVEKQAEKHLTKANEYFAQGDYNSAKSEIDSIKILYPKAFNTRREGIKLMQQVELKEQQISLNYLDSMMQQKQTELDAMKSRFVLEKDTAYQLEGNYLWPTQVVEKNLHRSFLRFQVSEQGIMSMTSIYCGGSNIHHTSVKVTAPDGTFAETPMANDSYETTDLGEHIEKADYRMGSDGGVMSFLYINSDKNIKVEYQGDRSYTFAMQPSDKAAAKEIYELSKVLSAIQQIKKEQEEANLKIAFINKRIKDKETEEAK